MATFCVYCEAPFEAAVDRCPECRRGQPVDADAVPTVGGRQGGVPGGPPFVVGAVLLVVGLVVPLVALAGWVMVFVGAAMFAQGVWSRLEQDVGPAD